MPIERRKEVVEAKKAMAAYKEQKDKRMFIKRRTKLIKSQWRNGIVGIEDTQGEQEQVIQPIDKTKIRSYFDRLEERKDSKFPFQFLLIICLILIELRAFNGASEQINFYTTPATSRKLNDMQGQRVLPMNQSWNMKARVSNVVEK